MKSIKKITIITLILLYFLMCKSFAATGVVNTTAVRVRKSQDTNSDIIMNIYENDVVEILENNGQWCKIKYNGDTGYVKTEFLKIKGSSSKNENTVSNKTDNSSTSVNNNVSSNTTSNTNNTVENNSQIANNTTNNTSSEVSVRLLPSISSKVIAKIKITEQINQILEINNWVKITDGTITGWVPKIKLSAQTKTPEENTQNNIEPENNSQPEEKEEEKVQETNVSKIGRINVETAKLRSKPDSTATIVDFLDYNDEVTIVGEEGDWYKITFKSLSGYVSKKLVTISVSSRSLVENREKLEDDSIIDEESNNSANNALSDTTSSITEDTSKSNSISTTGLQIVEYAKQYLGYSYVSGGKNPTTGFDCSGFTKYVYANFGYTLGNTAASQNSLGDDVTKNNLIAGDLILFYDEANTKIGHTGIYIGDGNFIHSANANRGVVIDNLNTNSYYNSRFVNAKRIVK